MSRIMRRSFAVAAIVVLIAAASCAAPTQVALIADDDGSTVTVRSGGTVVVELEGNPTTGFTWLEAEVPDVLESRGEPGFEPSSDALGAGGMMTLTYDAVETGEGTLKLDYARAWESVQPEDTFSVTVKVVE